MQNSSDLLFMFLVIVGITFLMFSSDRLHPYNFHRKMEKTWPLKGEMDWEVFLSRQSWQFCFIDNIIKVIFPICILNWCVTKHVSRQEKSINKRGKILLLMIQIGAFSHCTKFDIINCLFYWNLLSPHRRGYQNCCYRIQNWIQSSQLTELFLRSMATLRNKQKLAAVSTETPESTRNSQSQNTLDPEMA